MQYNKMEYYEFASAYHILANEYKRDENFAQAYINKKMEIISLLKAGITYSAQFNGEEELNLNYERIETLVKSYTQACAISGLTYNQVLIEELSKLDSWEYDEENYTLLEQAAQEIYLNCIRFDREFVMLNYGVCRHHKTTTRESVLEYISKETSPYIARALKESSTDILSLLDEIATDKRCENKNRIDYLLGKR